MTKDYKNKTKEIAEDIQDEIFQKMPIEKKIRLTSEFSAFLLKLGKLRNKNGISETT